mmetsp:Transcript_19737/g.51384  ORF Transcript_19737/g.51384 Transcript_19737/m.51384 type:complete len:210 (-) Transcript_19737:4256-4885(-)
MSSQYKVVLLGEGCVGKTSLVLRYCQNVFNDKHLTTLQASFLKKRLNIKGSRVDLAIWDTAGQERFHALGPIYYRDSNGAVLVYDITDEDSFVKVKNWVKELRKMLGQDISLCIVGNKSDMEKNRNVDQATAEKYAQSVGAVHFHTSAKLNRGIEDMFLDLTKRMMKAGGGGAGDGVARGSSRRRNNIQVVADDAPSQHASEEKKGGCC